MPGRPIRGGLGVAALIGLAFALHGYHFGVSDQKLYLPAALRLVDPTLFPFDAGFFLNEARFTLFDDGVAALRRAGVPLDATMLAGQLAALWLIVAGAVRLVTRAGGSPAAAWAGATLLVIVLPSPVAGTRVGIVEPYLHPRTLGVAVALWALLAAIDGRARAAALLVVAGVLHPLSGLWSAGHVLMQWPIRGRGPMLRTAVLVAVILTVVACASPAPPPIDDVTHWQTALTAEGYNVRFPLRWPWYEWVGVAFPLALLALAATGAPAPAGGRIARRLVVAASLGIVLALMLTVAPDRRWPLQPMRQLHLVYLVAIVMFGAWLEQHVLRGRAAWRAAAVVLAATLVVLFQQRYPSSPWIEWPGRLPDNAYVRAFDWIRTNTPVDARIAVDPFYLRRPGPDWHAARVFSQRSMLTDAVHDLDPAAMAPPLDLRWTAEQRALAGWRSFDRDDFARLARDFDVSWVVVAGGQAPGLDCPFIQPTVRVCRAR